MKKVTITLTKESEDILETLGLLYKINHTSFRIEKAIQLCKEYDNRIEKLLNLRESRTLMRCEDGYNKRN